MNRQTKGAVHQGVAYVVYGPAPNYSVSITEGLSDHHYRKLLKPCPFCKGRSGLRISNTHTPYPWVECECGVQLNVPNVTRPNLRTIAQAKLVMNCAIDGLIDHWNRRFKYRV